MAGQFDEVYQRALDDPETFWTEAAASIDWSRPFDKILDDSNSPFNKWFPGAECNTCYNAVDRHVAAGRGEQNAIIYDSPITEKRLRNSPVFCAILGWKKAIGLLSICRWCRRQL